MLLFHFDPPFYEFGNFVKVLQFQHHCAHCATVIKENYDMG